MTMPFELYKEVHCTTAAEFLDILTPHRAGELWTRARDDHEAWLFRGQSEAVWPLTPSAHRPNAFWPFRSEQREPDDARERLDWEEDCAMQFVSRASHYGYELPGDRDEIRDHENPGGPQDGCQFPPTGRRGLYALAQHHGLPTRLLDWTRGPHIAAYFAVVEAAGKALREQSPEICEKVFPGPRFVRDEGSNKRCAVWALSEWLVRHSTQFSPGAVHITVPTTSNPNLSRQRGLFTLVRYGKAHANALVGLPPSIDALLAQENIRESFRAAVEEHRRPYAPYFYKITLPHAEAGKALYALYLIGVHAGTIYEGRDAVSASMRETWLQTRVLP